MNEKAKTHPKQQLAAAKRAERLAEQLRANLKKRKASTKAGASGPECVSPDDGDGGGGAGDAD